MMPLRACALAPLLLLGAGCAVTRTDPDAAATQSARLAASAPVASAWPARWTEGLRACVIADLRGPLAPAAASAKSTEAQSLAVRRIMPVGQGLIAFNVATSDAAPDFRDWEAWESEEALRGVHQFNYYSWDPRERPVWELPEGRSETQDDLISLQRAMNRASIAGKFRLIMPECAEPKGLVLFVPPISAAALSLPVPRELIRRGWAVLSVDRIEVLQFTRTATVIEVPWSPPPKVRKPVKPQEPPPGAAGRWMGEWVRADMANMAYAFEAGLEFAQRAEPSLRAGPLVVVGASLGAIFTPPLIARLGDRVDGAVLIGGGANMLRIMADTDPDVFSIGLLVGEGDIRLNRKRGEAWEPEYLIQNPLDPVFTAPLLASIPTLMVHAKRDGLVPAKYGDLLWEKAGKPERWSLDSGHIYMFLTLSDQAREITDWIEDNVHAHVAPAR